MAMNNNKIACPVCGQEIELVPKRDNPERLVAFHACGGQGLRQVYETDAPLFPPPLLQDRLEPTEYPRSRKPK